jgi:hypothetical protein
MIGKYQLDNAKIFYKRLRNHQRKIIQNTRGQRRNDSTKRGRYFKFDKLKFIKAPL